MMCFTFHLSPIISISDRDLNKRHEYISGLESFPCQDQLNSQLIKFKTGDYLSVMDSECMYKSQCNPIVLCCCSNYKLYIFSKITFLNKVLLCQLMNKQHQQEIRCWSTNDAYGPLAINTSKYATEYTGPWDGWQGNGVGAFLAGGGKNRDELFLGRNRVDGGFLCHIQTPCWPSQHCTRLHQVSQICTS